MTKIRQRVRHEFAKPLLFGVVRNVRSTLNSSSHPPGTRQRDRLDGAAMSGMEEGMTPKERGDRPLEDPEGHLESALIEEFLRSRGLDSVALRALPQDAATRVLTEASVYASTKLAEVESRAHFVHEIHLH